MSAVAQILRAAAERIERDGWTQHLSGLGPNGECCIMVAVGKEFDALDIKGRDERQAMWSRLRAALEHHVRPHRGLMAVWNDTPGRTAEEVIAALRGAADASERGE